MDHATHVRLLGQALANSHALEVSTAVVLAEALDLDPEIGHLLSASMTQKGALNVLAALAKRDECKVDQKLLAEWVKLANRANEARNRIVHSPWWLDENDSTNLAGILSKGLRPSERSEEQLEDDMHLLGRAARNADALITSDGIMAALETARDDA